MYINKNSSALLTKLQSHSRATIGTLADAIEATNRAKQKQPLLPQSPNCSSLTGSLLSTSGMSALEKYQYMFEQGKASGKLNLPATNAEQALKEANEIIQKAAFAKNKISSNDLIKALVIRQQCSPEVNLSA